MEKITCKQLEEARDLFENNKIDIEEISQAILCKLLLEALEKIDHLENIVLMGNEDDERDAMDSVCDHDFILFELFNSLIEKIKCDTPAK